MAEGIPRPARRRSGRRARRTLDQVEADGFGPADPGYTPRGDESGVGLWPVLGHLGPADPGGRGVAVTASRGSRAKHVGDACITAIGVIRRSPGGAVGRLCRQPIVVAVPPDWYRLGDAARASLRSTATVGCAPRGPAPEHADHRWAGRAVTLPGDRSRAPAAAAWACRPAAPRLPHVGPVGHRDRVATLAPAQGRRGG